MHETIVHNPPISITDLVLLKERGANISLSNTFEINEVDLAHEENPFKAFLFFSVFSGTVDDLPYQFRKCYAKGCQHNLCPHVSQAVMIANRYLKRDYARMQKVGINFEESLFTLEHMLAEFESKRDEFVVTLILEDYIRLAGEGEKITIEVRKESFPAVENFFNHTEVRVYFSVDFHVTYLGETHICHRCFSCYAMDRESEDIETARDLANRRLSDTYASFDRVGITHNKVFFE